MATLFNDDDNLKFMLTLVCNDKIDIDIRRNNNLNWIPCSIILEADEEKVMYSDECICDVSLAEIEFFILQLKQIIDIKSRGGLLKENFTFIPRENLFEMSISETKEEDLLELELWFNIGQVTNGKSYGYSKGFRFLVTITSLDNFKNVLEKEIDKVLKYIGMKK